MRRDSEEGQWGGAARRGSEVGEVRRDSEEGW